MNEKLEQFLDSIDKAAKISGHEHAFIEGLVFGLGQAHVINCNYQTEDEFDAAMAVLLEIIDSKYFKGKEQ